MSKQPHIILLCRYHRGRLPLMKRAMDSLNAQTYKNHTVLASFEEEYQKEELKSLGIDSMIKVEPNRNFECFYNLYINDLKSKLGDDLWAMIYDSDSFFYSNVALEILSHHLTNPDELVLCQFERKLRKKPSDELMDARVLRSGKCDFANLAFHSKYKDLVQVGGNDNSDYFMLKEMTERIKTKWVKFPVISTDRRSRGL